MANQVDVGGTPARISSRRSSTDCHCPARSQAQGGRVADHVRGVVLGTHEVQQAQRFGELPARPQAWMAFAKATSFGAMLHSRISCRSFFASPPPRALADADGAGVSHGVGLHLPGDHPSEPARHVAPQVDRDGVHALVGATPCPWPRTPAARARSPRPAQLTTTHSHTCVAQSSCCCCCCPAAAASAAATEAGSGAVSKASPSLGEVVVWPSSSATACSGWPASATSRTASSNAPRNSSSCSSSSSVLGRRRRRRRFLGHRCDAFEEGDDARSPPFVARHLASEKRLVGGQVRGHDAAAPPHVASGAVAPSQSPCRASSRNRL